MLLEALNTGHVVRAVVHFDKCTLVKSSASSEKIGKIPETGGVTIDNFMHYKQFLTREELIDTVAISKTLFTITNYKGLDKIATGIRMHFYPTNQVKLAMTVMELKTNIINILF